MRTHLVRLCWSVHWSGWECPCSAGSRSRPSDMDSDKPAFMLGAPKPTCSNLWRPSPQALISLRGCLSPEASLFRGITTAPEAFLEPLGVSRLRPMRPDPPKKATLVWSVGRMTNTEFLPARAMTHLVRPCWSVHGSGRVGLSSTGRWSRPSDMDSGKPAFLSGAPRLASSSFRGRPSRL